MNDFDFLDGTWDVWSGTAAESPRWEQFFSLDEGTSWIHNWTMDFTRRP
ncbi:hypothetical protein OG765_16080 [Streptomyces sp. NBC_00555]|nr:hypothetical protein [Streptomyces sp. NBC_00555]MCX5012507.1 hypothetical protein [Streptomyces sp. NBC_00555]